MSPADIDICHALPVTKDVLEIDSHCPGGISLTIEKARDLTDAIKGDIRTLWIQFLRAYEGGAHVALGYPNWAEYCQTEFQIGRARSYQILDAARVVGVIESAGLDSDTEQSTMADSPIENERVARELTSLLDEPAALVEAYTKAVATAPRDNSGKPAVTAKHVRAVVGSRLSPVPEPTTTKAPCSASRESAPATVADAIETVTTAIEDRQPVDVVTKAASVALKVLDDRGRVTPPEALGKCIDGLLHAIQHMAERQS